MLRRQWYAVLLSLAFLLLPAAPLWAQSDQDEAPAATAKKAAPPPTATQSDPNPALQAPTIGGLSGLFRTVTSDIGSPHTFRLALHTELFKSSGFLVQNDSNSRFVGTLAGSYTPWQYLEFFLNIRSTANNNDRTDPGRLDQAVILALGDLAFGAKGQYPITPYLAVGGNLGISLLNSVGGVTFSGDATGFYIGALTSFDLAPLANNFPLRFHLNLGYQLDNSNNLAKFPGYSLASLQVEKFALGINPSRMQLRFGLDAPLKRFVNFGLTPILEVAADFALGDADADFVRFQKPAGTLDPSQIDGKSTAWMTIGVRVNPVRGLLVDLASDIGFASPGYGHGPPVVPWNFILGLGYAYDTNPPTRVVTRESVKTVVRDVSDQSKMGKVRGRVVNAKTLEPIEGAVVTLPGKDLTGLSTDPDGSFLSYPLPPGNHPLVVRHPDYQPAKLVIAIKQGVVGTQDIKLEPAAPRVIKVSGRVTNQKGKAVAATISAGEGKQVTADESGGYTMELKPGSHTLAATAEGYLRKEQIVTAAPGAPITADFSLSARPKTSLVKLAKKEIVIARQVHFATNGATILPDSQQLLDSIVDLLLSNPNIKKVEIGGHTDNRGKPEANLQLSQARADAVKDHLVKNGVPADRLVAKGYGQTKPKAPNITPANRARNRRVEFNILEQ
jgi:outer membrane protein OmpA-like peptidoglycan-associated protein